MSDNKQKNSVQKEIADHPILSLFIVVFSTAITTFGTMTFASMTYVDKKIEEAKRETQRLYVTTRRDIEITNSEVKKEISELRTEIRNLNNNLLKIYSKRI